MSSSRAQSTLLRQFVDGELGADEARRLEDRLARDERLRRQVAFEGRLRERVTTVMRSSVPSAPPALVQRVRQALSDAAPEPATTTVTAASRRWLAGPRRANVFAVAASMLLVAGAVLFGIYGPSIDRLGDPGPSLVTDAALFASREHGLCATDSDNRTAKAERRTPESARRLLDEHLGRPVTVFDLGPRGYRFFGAGQCRIPGHERSGHMLYMREDGKAMVSIFVLPDSGQFDPADGLPLDSDRWYPSQGGPECRHHVLRSSDGALVYFLVCCQEEDLEAIAGSLLDQIQAR